MQVPKRRSQMLKRQDDEGGDYLTASAVERLKRDLQDLTKNQRPLAVEDLSAALAKGDLSENAEYQEAKARLSRIDGRIFSITDRLKRVQVIDETKNPTGRVRLGSTVILEPSPGIQRTYQIVGPQETDPSRGRISHLSPLGAALLDHVVGDSVTITSGEKKTAYRIVEVR